MSVSHEPRPIRVGVFTEEPLRLEGIASIFEEMPGEGYAALSPVFGSMDELLSDCTLAFLMVDLHSSSSGIKILATIRRRRPGLRLIVIGPEGDEELVIESIMAGARAYLDLKASPRIVRLAMEEATNGSIWAPRRLLSQLIDRLLGMPDAGLSNEPPHLTERESQVLALILTARSNREIARQLGIEERTVQAHVSRLMRKTGTDNRINLLMRSSNPELLKSAGIADRRQVERRHGERRAGPPEGRRDVTDK